MLLQEAVCARGMINYWRSSQRSRPRLGTLQDSVCVTNCYTRRLRQASTSRSQSGASETGTHDEDTGREDKRWTITRTYNNRKYIGGLNDQMKRIQGGPKKVRCRFRANMSIKLRRLEEREQKRTATEKLKHCLWWYFHVKYFTARLFHV